MRERDRRKVENKFIIAVALASFALVVMILGLIVVLKAPTFDMFVTIMLASILFGACAAIAYLKWRELNRLEN